jgi:type VI protein secretion system component VasK
LPEFSKDNPMAAPAPAQIPVLSPDPEKKIDAVYKLLAIAAILVGFVAWLASTNSTATDARALSQKNSETLEKKADKEEIRQQLQLLNNKLDELDRYLREHK